MLVTADEHGGAYFLDKQRTEIELLGIQHIIVHIIRVMYGLILYRDTWPGGPVGYFSDVSEWTFNVKNHLYIFQSLIGDAVMVSVFLCRDKLGRLLISLQLYRVYMVWQSKLILIPPLILWCAAGGMCITRFGCG